VIYGYARVSTDAQDLSNQLAELKAAGCDPIFREKITGAHAERPQLKRLLRKVTHGDVVIVPPLRRCVRLVAVTTSVRKRFGGFLPESKLGDNMQPLSSVEEILSAKMRHEEWRDYFGSLTCDEFDNLYGNVLGKFPEVLELYDFVWLLPLMSALASKMLGYGHFGNGLTTEHRQAIIKTAETFADFTQSLLRGNDDVETDYSEAWAADQVYCKLMGIYRANCTKRCHRIEYLKESDLTWRFMADIMTPTIIRTIDNFMEAGNNIAIAP